MQKYLHVHLPEKNGSFTPLHHLARTCWRSQSQNQPYYPANVDRERLYQVFQLKITCSGIHIEHLSTHLSVLIYATMANTQSVGSQFSFMIVPSWNWNEKQSSLLLHILVPILPQIGECQKKKRQKWNIYFAQDTGSAMKTSAHGKLDAW